MAVVFEGVFEEGGRIVSHEAFLGESDGKEHPRAGEDEDRQGGGPPIEACEIPPAAIHDEREDGDTSEAHGGACGEDGGGCEKAKGKARAVGGAVEIGLPGPEGSEDEHGELEIGHDVTADTDDFVLEQEDEAGEEGQPTVTSGDPAASEEPTGGSEGGDKEGLKNDQGARVAPKRKGGGCGEVVAGWVVTEGDFGEGSVVLIGEGHGGGAWGMPKVVVHHQCRDGVGGFVRVATEVAAEGILAELET